MSKIAELNKRLICIANNVLDGNIECISTEELGYLIDMIKDCAQAEYYCSFVKSSDVSADNMYDKLSEMMASLSTDEKQTAKQKLMNLISKM